MRTHARRPTPRRRTGVAGAAAALAVALAAPLAGQTGDVTLTLEDALAMARGTNPTYRQALNQTSLNTTEARGTLFSQVLPTATLDLFNTNFRGNIQRRARNNFGEPIDNPNPEWVYFSDTSQSLSLTWRIQGTSVFNALDRQRLVNRDRELGVTAARTTLDVAVERAFWDALEQRELMRAEEELVDARRLDQQAAERLFTMAMRTQVDVLNAELSVEQQIVQLQQQQAAFERAKLALRTQLGDTELGDFQLADAALPLFDPEGLSADELVPRALDVNAELRRAEVGVASSNVEVRDSKRAWWPSLVVNYQTWRRAQAADGTDALFDVSFDEDLDHSFYIGLEFPAFSNFFGTKQDVHRSEVQLENARETERATRLRVEETVRSALLELENQWETLQLSERALVIAQEALRLAREEYRLGTRSFTELRATIDQEANQRRAVIQARYGFVDALLSLEEAVGTQVRG